MRRGFILLFLAFALLSCRHECDSNKEPILRLYNSSDIVYTKIYGFETRVPIATVEFQVWDLPVSMVSDRTTYVLEKSNGATEELTVIYHRQARMESNRCGFKMYLTGMELDVSTTVKNVHLTPDFFNPNIWDGHSQTGYYAVITD